MDDWVWLGILVTVIILAAIVWFSMDQSHREHMRRRRGR